MQARFQPHLPERAETPVIPCLSVLILYEDFGTGLRAKHSLDMLPKQGPAPAPWSTKLWRIDLLSDPLLGEQAVLEAAAADVIILSVHGRGELPAVVREWLNSWLGRKQNRPCVLGVLLDSEEASQGGDNPVLAYAQQVATAAGANLFYGYSEAPVSELDSVMTEIDERACQSSSVLEDMLKRTESYRGWGINE
jgi:hypothetical protein